jgi:hypothetical protein
MTVKYNFNSSLQNSGEFIEIGLDVVYNLKGEEDGPWNYLVDCACNMFFLDSMGIHNALERTSDAFDNANILCSLIELTKNRITFIPSMSDNYRRPHAENEINNIRVIRGCTEFQAEDSFRRSNTAYRLMYRVKYLQRIAKLVHEGWKITNLNIKFLTYPGNTNGETSCAISHDDFTDGQILVQLGNRTFDWTQTSIMTWQSLVQYLFSSLTRLTEVNSESLYLHWYVICPISKSTVDITESRSLCVVIKEAIRYLRDKNTYCDL